jgi:hypothetical protein
VGQWPW